MPEVVELVLLVLASPVIAIVALVMALNAHKGVLLSAGHTSACCSPRAGTL